MRSLFFTVPDLMGPEFANTLWKKARRREISQSEADEILGAFEELRIEVVPSKVLLEDAFQMAVRLDCSASTLVPHILRVEDLKGTL